MPGHAPGAYLTAGNFVQTQIPSATWGNSQVGFRLHTLVSNTEMTMFYLWSHDYNPVARINNRIIVPSGVPGLSFRQVNLFYPQYQAFGITANRPLYLPGALAQLPLVVRAEALYKNHDAFNTFAVPGTAVTGFRGANPAGCFPVALAGCSRNFSPSAVTRSDTVTWLMALDLDSRTRRGLPPPAT